MDSFRFGSGVIATLAGAYAANQVVGANVISNLFTSPKGNGIIRSISLLDQSKQSAAFDLFLLSSPQFGSVTPGVALDIQAGAMNNNHVLGVVSFVAGDLTTYNNFSMFAKTNIFLPVYGSPDPTPASTGSRLEGRGVWAIMVTRGTPTYASAQLQLRIGVEQSPA